LAFLDAGRSVDVNAPAVLERQPSPAARERILEGKLEHSFTIQSAQRSGRPRSGTVAEQPLEELREAAFAELDAHVPAEALSVKEVLEITVARG
jgi:hypothetical protein